MTMTKMMRENMTLTKQDTEEVVELVRGILKGQAQEVAEIDRLKKRNQEIVSLICGKDVNAKNESLKQELFSNIGKINEMRKKNG